jgi:hypothetical protein
MSEALDWAPSTSPKQDLLRWLVHPDNPDRKPYTCVSGPRMSSKTIGCLHAVVENAWLVNRARWSMLSPTVTNATDGGFWNDLTEVVIPKWIEADIGMKWHKEPYVEAVSKRHKCSIINSHGTVSVFQLESFREGANIDDLKTRFKGKRFNGIYWSEAGTWVKTREAFDILMGCFRSDADMTWKKDDYTMLIDTNPEPPGEAHWIYEMFYKFRTLDSSVLMDLVNGKDVSIEDMLRKQNQLGLIEFFVKDNPFLTPDQLAELKTRYAHSPELWDRYYLGKWTSAASDGLFFDVFRPVIHTAGESETPINKEPLLLLPSDDCHELFCGVDPGISNYAAVIAEEFLWPDKHGKEQVNFNVVDELVWLAEDASIGEFTGELMAKMDFWENLLNRKVRWHHFSDRSAFDMRESISNRRQHVEVALVSNKRIMLTAVMKGDGSVRQRIDILRKLLHQDRITFSKARCPHTIRAVESLRKGKNYPLDKQSEHKHAFDALTYMLSTRCYQELFRQSKTRVERVAPVMTQIVL